MMRRYYVFDADAVIKILYSMGYTNYNISQRLNDIEVLVLLQKMRKHKIVLTVRRKQHMRTVTQAGLRSLLAYESVSR